MSSDSKPESEVPAQHYAAFAVAIGWLRGAVDSVLHDDFTKEDLKRVHSATSTAQIAKALGKKEGDLSIDWNDYLTEQQKHRIGGDEI